MTASQPSTSIQLASNQQDIWHDQHANPKTPLYNIGGTLIISGKVYYKHLNKAIQRLVDENDAFRITINNQLLTKQKILKKVNYNLEFIDFSNDLKAEDKAHHWLDQHFQQPFSINKNNLLWHFALIKESEDRYYLMTKYHHLIADGWSTTVVIARLAEIYNAFLNKKNIQQRDSPPYFDFIKREQDYLRSPHYQIDKVFWETNLPIIPEPLISRRYPISCNTLLPKAHNYQFKINRTLYNTISQFSSENNCTNYQVFLSALAVYFSQIYQREDVIIGVPNLNRKGARFKDAFGMFISLSPLVFNIAENESFSQLVKQCKSCLRTLYRHQRFPLSNISKRLNLLHNGRDTLFDIVFSYEKHQYSTHYGSATIQAKQQFSGVARYPLAVTLCDFNDNPDIDVFFEGAENCFTGTDLQFLGARFLSILEQICGEPQKQIKQTNLLTVQDKNIAFKQFNPKPNQPSATTCPTVIQLFQQQVKTQPTKIAVEFKGITLTYHQLDELSTQLAEHLINLRTKKNDIIAICLPQCPEVIIGILAILKSSAAYLPISADNPDARIKTVLQQSQSYILLTNTHFQSRLTSLHNHLVCADNYLLQNSVKATPAKNFKAHPDTLAYIIYTSGSNGLPKGVRINHHALSLRMQWLQSLFKVTSVDRMGQTIAYTFDASVIEIFLSLTQGASLILRPEESQSAESFANFIIDKKITAAALVPSSARLLLQGLNTSQKTNLRIACCGGEPLPPKLAKQFVQKTDALLFNLYGPTEATIAASAWKYTPGFSANTLPIGHPANDTAIYIMDNHLKHLPVNVEGEIIITGKTLAQGYLNQPKLNQQSFLTLPSHPFPLYKTGDKGYIGHDGLLYFSGRIDRQVKISGYRIELGEIEAVLQTHPSVDIAAVVSHTINHKSELHAYIETKETNLTDALSLLLRQQLPNYMQVKQINLLTTLKTDLAGKVDYSQLSIPVINLNTSKKRSARTTLELQLHSQWSKVLTINSIGIDQNFFDLGGDSISAINLMVAIEQLTNTRYPLSFLLQHPTIAEQAKQLDTTQPSDEQPVLQTLSQHQTTDLFIAASGHGDFMRLSNLADTLGDCCSTHLLQPSSKQNQPLSINQIAQSYADSILDRPKTAYYIAGFSIGGITALETARILINSEHPPKGLILFDSVYPRWPLQSPALFKFIKYFIKTFHFNRIILNNRRLGSMLNDRGIQSQIMALPGHTIQAVELPVDLILTKRMWMFHPLIFSTWKKLFGHHLAHHFVSGLHGEMFQHPHCQQLAVILKKIIKP